MREQEATLSPFDRGFIYGDSIYEVIPAFWGEPFALSAHMARLRRSAAAAHIRVPWGDTELDAAIMEVVRANRRWTVRTPVCRVGLWVSRGVQSTDWKVRRDADPTIVVFCWPVDHMALRKAAREGLRLVVAGRRKTPADVLDPRLKTASRLPLVLAELETQDLGDMPLLLNDRGHITESSSANVFMVVNGLLCTPRASDVLEGVTREVVIELATKAGLELCERDLSTYDVTIASEIFMTSSSMGIAPARRVSPYRMEFPVPGPLTKQLMQGLAKATGYDPLDVA